MPGEAQDPAGGFQPPRTSAHFQTPRAGRTQAAGALAVAGTKIVAETFLVVWRRWLDRAPLTPSRSADRG